MSSRLCRQKARFSIGRGAPTSYGRALPRARTQPVTAEQKRELMMSNPAFASIDAVKNDRFVTLEYVEATPGPRNIQAIKTLAEAFRGS